MQNMNIVVNVQEKIFKSSIDEKFLIFEGDLKLTLTLRLSIGLGVGVNSYEKL